MRLDVKEVWIDKDSGAVVLHTKTGLLSLGVDHRDGIRQPYISWEPGTNYVPDLGTRFTAGHLADINARGRSGHEAEIRA